jgi:hypothetical protein
MKARWSIGRIALRSVPRRSEWTWPNRTCLLNRQQFVRDGRYRRRVLTTNQKGALAEAKVAATAVELGFGVSWPFGDERYDLILDLRPELLRVQCKWAVRRGNVVVVTCRTNRRGPSGFIPRLYADGEIDAIAAYCAATDRCYLLPAALSIGRAAVHLRLTQPRNNQQLRINWAQDFELGATLTKLRGPIAQLGERRDGIAKVAGSSPAGSTSEAPQGASRLLTIFDQ